MKISTQILLPSDTAGSSNVMGTAPDNGQFAGMVTANTPQPPADNRQSSPPDKALADDRGGTIETNQAPNAEVRQAAENPPRPADVREPRLPGSHQQLAEGRRSNAAVAAAGGKALPVEGEVVVDPSLLALGDAAAIVPGEGEQGTDVAGLLPEIATLPAVPAMPTLPEQPLVAPIVDPLPEETATLAEGTDPAASGGGEGQLVRRDNAPRPAELDQLRTARAQGMAWEEAQTVLAPSGQQPDSAAQSALGEMALAPQPAKDVREGASTAQLLAGAEGGDKSEVKSLKELREARLAAASSSTTAKGSSFEAASPSPLLDAGSLARSAQAPAQTATAVPTGPTDTSLTQLVDRLIETRVAARAERSNIELTHPDFGRVTLAVGLRSDDRLSVDLPGAPAELRQALGQALAQPGASQGSAQSGSQNGNQSTSQRSEGQGQSAAAGGETGPNGGGNNQDPRRNTDDQDNAHLSIFAQSRRAGSDSGASKSAGGPASGNRRGVLA